MGRPDVDGLNTGYAALLLEQYLDNPGAVPEEWRDLFESEPEVLLEEQRRVARIQPVNVGTFHVQARCSSEPLPERLAEGHCDRESEEEADGRDEHGGELKAPLAATHARGDEGDRQRRHDQAERVPRESDEADEDGDRGKEAGDGLGRRPVTALVEDLAVGVQRSAILPARAAAARSVRA